MPLNRHEGLQRGRRTDYNAGGFPQAHVPKHGQQVMQQSVCNETSELSYLCHSGILARTFFSASA